MRTAKIGPDLSFGKTITRATRQQGYPGKKGRRAQSSLRGKKGNKGNNAAGHLGQEGNRATRPGEALKYFLGGYVPPGTPNWHPENTLWTRYRPLLAYLSKMVESALAARATIRQPCKLKHRVQQEYNSFLVNALNRIFKSNLSLNN